MLDSALALDVLEKFASQVRAMGLHLAHEYPRPAALDGLGAPINESPRFLGALVKKSDVLAPHSLKLLEGFIVRVVLLSLLCSSLALAAWLLACCWLVAWLLAAVASAHCDLETNWVLGLACVPDCLSLGKEYDYN